MPIVYRDPLKGRRTTAEQIPASTSEILTEQFAQTFEENPIVATKRFFELRAEKRGGTHIDAASAREQLKLAGMDADLTVDDAGITQEALDTLIWRKAIEKRRQDVFARSEGGIGQTAARLSVSFATTLADPLSAGLNFVPVVGQARYAKWLNSARGLAGRAGVRAGVGAVEGTAGAAIVEPLIYGSRTYEQADYDAVDSLMNVTFGGVIGAGLHTTVGTAGEFVPDFLSPIPRDRSLRGVDRDIERNLSRRIRTDYSGSAAEYAALPGADGGKLLNTDIARELSPEYRADRTRSAAVHEPASYLVKQMYRDRLAQAPGQGEDAVVLFTGGGTGAGKTTGLEAVRAVNPDISRAQIIYDTNLNGMDSSVRKIEQALTAGKRVSIVYTYRDPVKALTEGALPRAERVGRTVPIKEHAKTHVGGAATIKQLAEKYSDDDRVSIAVLDNSGPRGSIKSIDPASVPVLEYDSVLRGLQDALDAEYKAGRISEAVYAGTAGVRRKGAQGVDSRAGRVLDQGDEGALSPRPAEVVDELPSRVQQDLLRTAVGQAIQGRPIDVDGIIRAATGNDRSALSNSAQTIDAEAQQLDAFADEILSREPEIRETSDLVKLATEEETLARAELKALQQRLGVEPKDAEYDSVIEAADNAERWAKTAEAATVCLMRGIA